MTPAPASAPDGLDMLLASMQNAHQNNLSHKEATRQFISALYPDTTEGEFEELWEQGQSDRDATAAAMAANDSLMASLTEAEREEHVRAKEAENGVALTPGLRSLALAMLRPHA